MSQYVKLNIFVIIIINFIIVINNCDVTCQNQPFVAEKSS